MILKSIENIQLYIKIHLIKETLVLGHIHQAPSEYISESYLERKRMHFKSDKVKVRNTVDSQNSFFPLDNNCKNIHIAIDKQFTMHTTFLKSQAKCKCLLNNASKLCFVIQCAYSCNTK